MSSRRGRDTQRHHGSSTPRKMWEDMRSGGGEDRDPEKMGKDGDFCDPGPLQSLPRAPLLLPEEGFLPGSTLSKLMAEAHPDVVSAVKSALGGKGWLRKLLCDQPELDVVEVSAPGHGEPCYAIRDRWDSRPVREGGPPSREQRPGTDLQRELPPFRRDPNMAAMSWPRLRGAGGPR
ncbi:unnamed protein product [Prorocentrum cordatum]|uniref:Uncharacterized protein n=1 Tax=Prorocentrum cordatum TaxID=2364126 RepID=A0ABN9RX81_9DINO|nr:unnamed protein product [Polarella glacialis]